MQYDQKQFTQKGLDMFSSALSNKESITVDKVIVDDLPTNNFSNLALLSLDSFADAMSFQANYTETSGNTLTVDAVMSNKGFTSSYTINELGLVGHIGDDVNNQSLMAVLVASDPFTLPAQQNNETPSQFIPNITIQLSNDDMGQVPVLVQDDAYVAQKDLDNLVGKDGYVKADEVDARIKSLNDGKADKTAMYGKTDINSMVNNLTDVKADKVSVYSKDDVDNKVDNVNSRIDSLNDGKADKVQMYGKTDIDSKVNNANARIDSLNSGKADKEDVNNQMTNLNNGKADKTAIYGKTDVDWRVNNANSRIDSLNDGKQDKQDSTNKFNYMNTIKANTDDMKSGDLQTYNSANSYTDQKYSDLDNKNNILSQNLDKINKTYYATIEPCDLNNVTNAGFYTSPSYLNQYQNIPSNIFAIVAFNFIVIANGGDVTQEIHASGMNPMFRKKQWGSWSNWHQIATDDDLQNKTNDLSNAITSLNDGKADKVQMYGKTDIDSKVNGLNDAKADKINVYSKTDVDNQYNYLNTIKANTNDMNDHIKNAFNSANNYTNYQVGGINNQINSLNDAKADKYNTYSKSDVDSKLNELASKLL